MTTSAPLNHAQRARPALAALALAGALLICGAAPAIAQEDVTNARWRIEAIGGAPTLEAGKTRFTITPDGQLSGSAGCNSFGGAGSFKAGGVTVGPLHATQMACPQPLMEQEGRFISALKRSVRYELREDALILRDAAGAETARLRRQ